MSGEFFRKRKVGSEVIYPAFNYMGMKTRLIPDIRRLARIGNPCSTRFIDVFTGSGAVSVNMPFRNTVMNDRVGTLVEFYEWCSHIRSFTGLQKEIEELARKYPNTNETFNDFVREYKENPSPLMFWYLSYRSYNSSPKFSPDGSLRASSRGKGYEEHVSLNTMAGRLYRFAQGLQEKDIRFTSLDFRELPEAIGVSEDDIWYLDPPYLGSDADYTDDWTKESEEDLFHLLYELSGQSARFILSYCIQNKGKVNHSFLNLYEWYRGRIEGGLHMRHLGISYSNCTANRSVHDDFSDEVLITNYKI